MPSEVALVEKEATSRTRDNSRAAIKSLMTRTTRMITAGGRGWKRMFVGVTTEGFGLAGS